MKTCSFCGCKSLGYTSKSFLEHVCSLACEEARFEEYVLETLNPESLFEYSEDFRFARTKALELIKKNNDLEHELESLKEQLKDWKDYAERLEDTSGLTADELEEERIAYFERRPRGI